MTGPPPWPVPAVIRWLRDEAGLRPPAVARLVGVHTDAYARWCTGAWVPTPEEVPLVHALAALHARVCAAVPDGRARRAWWADARREVGWISPAKLLRRGKVGEVLLLLAASEDGAANGS